LTAIFRLRQAEGKKELRMEQLIVQVKDKEKAKMLLDLLAALDFVHSVQTCQAAAAAESQDEPPDFFALAGLWQDRETSLESIRQQAWPRRQQ
jgi:hypothetical protein